ncbi:MAG TPA: transposase [Candidatus Acidoferrales bacterium]|nr:transposase [Candidatus Acidoferrales bacterium]
MSRKASKPTIHAVRGNRIRNRGYLPHWEAEGGIYFVTFRLADSLPQSVIRELRQGELVKPQEEQRLAKKLEDFLDQGAGPCILRQPRIAHIVASALRQFDGARYRMLSWCVMPNHVNVVFQPLGEYDLARILHAWKSFTGVEINRQISRSGPLWQKEYYDHLIRSGEQLQRAIRYTAENPLKAGMPDWPYVYVSAEAFGGPANVDISKSH